MHSVPYFFLGAFHHRALIDSKLPPRLHFVTDKRLSTVKFVNTDIFKDYPEF